MTTIEKIEKKGYKVTFNMGYRNGQQCVVSVTATKGNKEIKDKSVSAVLSRIQYL